jgi:CubicO group peptidase (beta-lactamase class C family)
MRYSIPLLFAVSLSAQDGPSDARELAAFLDGVMEAQQKAHHFAGAVAVVVRDGQVLFEKGYGYSNHSERTPVDPERTLFRVASNSKMFVWTAVMQLVEQGRLDLHADVNQYLHGVQMPATFPQPITLANLMTHTAGFEDRVAGLFSKSQDSMRPLAEVIRTFMPNRVFPPGKITAYSNYGTALAGLIVEQVSGMPFEQYLRERILNPLGMQHATLSQPLATNLAPDMSKGYHWDGGKLQEKPFEYVPLAPCGGMSIAGGDMARFMIAELNDGAGVLRPETARLMRERLIAYSPDVPGMLHGFMGFENNGLMAFGHGGDTAWFHSQTTMIPTRKLGYFIAYNSDSGAAARSEFTPVFFDHYFPSPLPKEGAPPKEKRGQLRRFAGTYYAARNSLSDYTRFNQLMTAVNATVSSDGYLVMAGRRWRQLQPLLFAEVDGRRRLAFREDSAGNILDACASPICTSVWLKQPAWRGSSIETGAAEVLGAILLAGLIGIPIAVIVQRHASKPRSSTFARWLAWSVCGLFLGGALATQRLASATDDIVFGTPPAVRGVLAVWAIAACLAVPVFVFALVSWRRGWWRWPGRVSYAVLSVAAVAAAAWLWHWNLVGFPQ